MIEYLSLKGITALYEDEILAATNRVIKSGWYLLGEETKNFEQNYSEYIGSKYCVTCSNGLDALKLIFRAYIELGLLKSGDEVIVPANTYIASILSVTENGLKPIFVEPNIETFQIDEQLIEKAITPKTRAILLVHLYGRCAFTKKIEEIASKHQLLIIEDNAQAHGCKYNNLRTGALGDAGAHSFYPGKNLGALGDAGAITTNNEELAEVLKTLRNYGSAEKYVFSMQGYNNRIDEIQAAILNVKLAHLDKDNHTRKEIARIYQSIDNPKLTIPKDNAQDNVYHIFPLLCPDRADLQQYLANNGVQTMIHYPIPPHKQTAYKEYNHLELPITEYIHQHILSIPCNPLLSKREVDYIKDLLQNY